MANCNSTNSRYGLKAVLLQGGNAGAADRTECEALNGSATVSVAAGMQHYSGKEREGKNK